MVKTHPSVRPSVCPSCPRLSRLSRSSTVTNFKNSAYFYDFSSSVWMKYGQNTSVRPSVCPCARPRVSRLSRSSTVANFKNSVYFYDFSSSVFMQRQTLFVYENCYAHASAMQLCVCVCVHVCEHLAQYVKTFESCTTTLFWLLYAVSRYIGR